MPWCGADAQEGVRDLRKNPFREVESESSRLCGWRPPAPHSETDVERAGIPTTRFTGGLSEIMAICMEENKTERYLSICVLSDPRAADQACVLLEESGIPVIIQHLTVSASDEVSDERSGGSSHGGPRAFPGNQPAQATGFRLLVPMYLSQTAIKLLRRRSSLHPSAPGQVAPQRAA